MSFHITDTYDVTAPVGACVNEARRSTRITRNIVRDEAGEIKKLRGGRLREIDIDLRGKGDPGFAAVVAGAFVEGTPKITSAEGTEVNDGNFPDFQITAKAYASGNSAGGAGAGVGTAFQIDDFAITAISTAKTTQIRLRKTVEIGTPVLDEDGNFLTNEAYGELWEFTVEGSGDIPADGTIGGAGPAIAYVTGGISLVESTDESQSVGEEQTWEFAGCNAPFAA